MGSVAVQHLIKSYDEVVALKDVTVSIEEGEFFALLGPSGCGKTTTMRCIAGFETPTSGDIFINSQVVNDIPAHKRNCGMVFQSYALFPHYNVFENVAYGLTIRELYRGSAGRRIKSLARLMSRRLAKPSAYVLEKVNDALAYVELDTYADRAVSELSGGQQQRVALARALVMEPAVLLMDEPLSNLDKKLRYTMRKTIRRIQQEVGITTIFVTHDQEEAMSMADRIAVMRHGEIVQIATPTELYSRPQSSFVADFVGSSNIFPGEVEKRKQDRCVVRAGDMTFTSNIVPEKDEVQVMVRPESIDLYRNGADVNGVSRTNLLHGKVLLATYLGSHVRYDIQVGAYEMIVEETFQPGVPVLDQGEDVRVNIDPERVLLL